MKGQVEINTQLITENVITYVEENIKPMIYSIDFIKKFVKAVKDSKGSETEILQGEFGFNPPILTGLISEATRKLIFQKQFNSPNQIINTFPPEKMLDLADIYLDSNAIEIPFFCHKIIIDFKKGGKFNNSKSSILLRSQQQYSIPTRKFVIYAKDDSENIHFQKVDNETINTIKSIILKGMNGYIDISLEANSLSLIKYCNDDKKSYKELFKESCEAIKNSIFQQLVFYEYPPEKFQNISKDDFIYEINEIGEGNNKTYLALLKYSTKHLFI